MSRSRLPGSTSGKQSPANPKLPHIHTQRIDQPATSPSTKYIATDAQVFKSN